MWGTKRSGFVSDRHLTVSDVAQVRFPRQDNLSREPPQKIKKHKNITSKILNLDCVSHCGVYRIQKKKFNFSFHNRNNNIILDKLRI